MRTALSTLGVCCAAAGVVACGQRTTAGSSLADSSLARDLALAKADSANQPRLADTAATAQTSAAPAPQPNPAPPPKREHEAAHHATRHAATTAQPVSAAAPPAAPPAPPPPLVAGSGTAFDIVVSDSVSTSKMHVGDPVTATVASDVRDGSGAVVIPAGSVVHGSVTTSSGTAHTPHLAVGFNSVDVNGRSFPLQASIASLPTVQSRRTSRAAQVGEVGGGAVAGGLLGRLIGGKKSGGTVIGAVAGAAAGVVVADKTEIHDLVLPKGATVHVQLTAPVTVPQG